MDTYAVVPTCGRAELYACLDSLASQVTSTVVVTNGSYGGEDLAERPVHVIHDDAEGRNISRWWNLGLDQVERLYSHQGPYNVLIVNDDCTAGPESVSTLADEMRKHGVSLAFPGPISKRLTSIHEPERIAGWFFMLPGEQGLHADERYVWWAGDNDLDYRARALSGSLVVPGIDVQHSAPNGYT